MTKHEWHDRAEDGEPRFFRACHHAGRWEFYATLKSDPEWEKREILPLPIMEDFLEVLRNKYQRRRVPLKHVEQIETMVEELREAEEEAQAEEAAGDA